VAQCRRQADGGCGEPATRDDLKAATLALENALFVDGIRLKI